MLKEYKNRNKYHYFASKKLKVIIKVISASLRYIDNNLNILNVRYCDVICKIKYYLIRSNENYLQLSKITRRRKSISRPSRKSPWVFSVILLYFSHFIPIHKTMRKQDLQFLKQSQLICELHSGKLLNATQFFGRPFF